MNNITPTQMNKLNTWMDYIDGYMPSLHVCPECGGKAFGTTRWQGGMICYECGATWNAKRVIIKVCKYDPDSRFPDRRVMHYDSGWFEIDMTWKNDLPSGYGA
jgi:RNA polymerase subunit RPABC4/transcription elongation factor Spt4